MIKVLKFGGTSMSSAKSINQAADIILRSGDNKFVVVSAAGKRFGNDEKITDILYSCFNEKQQTGTCAGVFTKVRARYDEIIKDLNLKLDLAKIYDETEEGINNSATPDYAASRGEYISALIMAERLNYTFVDAADIIKFSEDGSFNAELSNKLAGSKLKGLKNAVIPGFYGAKPNDTIRTFSRGGSDVSGAVIARAVSADVYENWTDVNGFMTADPRIVDDPQSIKELSYRELRELAYMGANVLHPESIFPVKADGIPINIRNTFEPDNPGTMIVPKRNAGDDGSVITGIAGRQDFVSILIEKAMMNSEMGFCRRVLTECENLGISVEHIPTGIDTMSLVICENMLTEKEDMLIEKIKLAVAPDLIEITKSLTLIATVGDKMSHKIGTAGRLCAALSKAGINIKMIDQGSSEMNIIVAVENKDYKEAVKAIYSEFVK